MLVQIASRSDEAGHVNVVAAGVHHADLFALVVERRHLARVRYAGLLDDRKSVEVGTDEHRRAVAILHDADDARFSHAFRHLGARGFQLGRDALRGFDFLE